MGGGEQGWSPASEKQPFAVSRRVIRSGGIHVGRTAGVITIIASLAATVLPALNRANESGRRSHCTNNLPPGELHAVPAPPIATYF